MLKAISRGAVTVIAVMVLTMACGGGNSTPSTASSGFKSVVPDTLTVISVIPFANFLNGTPDNVTGGLDWALSNELAKRFGLHKVVFRNVDFAAMVSGQILNYDVGIAEIYVNPKRQAVNDYTQCYRHAYTTPLVKKGVTISTLDDLKKISWGVEQGSGPEAILINKIKPTAPFRSYPSLTQLGAQALQNGSVQGIFSGLEDIGSLFNNQYIRDNYYAPVKVVTTDTPMGDCIAVQLPKGSANLKLVDDALGAIMSAGMIHPWELQWLPYGNVDTSKLPTITLT